LTLAATRLTLGRDSGNGSLSDMVERADEMTTFQGYSVICILHGNVEQFDVPDIIAARKLASDLVILRRADCVEIYDEHDEVVTTI
jgi:hypothetical protein